MTSALFKLMMTRESAVWEARQRMITAELRFYELVTGLRRRPYRELRVAKIAHNQCIEELLAAERARERVKVYRRRQLARRKARRC